MIAKLHRRLRSERGAAMIEMALALPLLLMLLFGILDFGRAINYWNDANQIAADGARFAAVNRNPGAGAGLSFTEWLRRQAVSAELYGSVRTQNMQAGDEIRVCVDYPGLAVGSTPKVGDPIEVRVEAKYRLLQVTDTMNGVAIPIKGSATMRLEVPPDPATFADTCT